jgi:hypothetical protein
MERSPMRTSWVRSSSAPRSVAHTSDVPGGSPVNHDLRFVGKDHPIHDAAQKVTGG